ncbi:hypothetical protein [uncultured Polaribacter sp.]|uniref:hypothetical protein n=1 Tax=uncultured Polaribacter sp. TaxID=174711 RepID=UPI002638C2D9|nr:hypothetical protein [uncultured Polaribacter sp.]
MKKNYLIFILLISFGVKAQNIKLLNKDLNLTDTLKYNREIRIYSGGGINNYSSVFRMYNYERKKWKAEFYEHYAEIPNKTELKIEKKKLKPKNNFDFIFLKFLRSKVMNLPNQEEISWKIQGRDSIFETKTNRKGKEIIEYESVHKSISILDGVSYTVQVKEFNKTNEFKYYNPESYYKNFNEIDELLFMVEILNIVRNEFKIWKKN